MEGSDAAPDLVGALRRGDLPACVARLREPIRPAALDAALEGLQADRDVYPILRLAEALTVFGLALPDEIRVTLGRHHARALMTVTLPGRAAAVLEALWSGAARGSPEPEQAALRLLLARGQWEAGRGEAALETLAQAERRWPDDARFAVLHLEILAIRDPDAALALLRRLDADPVRAAGLDREVILRGDVLIGAGLAEEAAARARAYAPDDPDAARARVNAQAGREDRVAWADAMNRYLALVSRSATDVCRPVDGPILAAFGRAAPPAAPPAARLAVILDVRDAAETLQAAVASILAQTFEAFRLIPIDDGSTDGSGAIIRAFAARDPRIAVVESPVRLGACPARNLALQLAAAEYYAVYQADAWMHPEHLDRAMARIGPDPGIACVASRRVRIARNGRLSECGAASVSRVDAVRAHRSRRGRRLRPDPLPRLIRRRGRVRMAPARAAARRPDPWAIRHSCCRCPTRCSFRRATRLA